MLKCYCLCANKIRESEFFFHPHSDGTLVKKREIFGRGAVEVEWGDGKKEEEIF
jgi:hypothetical protein